jgi:iron complex transport system ATP-binding protein
MLEAAHLSLELGGSTVLREVDLELRPGEIVVVAGPNRAGKSTLLACLSGLMRPSAGVVRIDGDDPALLSSSELARRRAVLEQSPEFGAPFLLRELVGLAIPRAVPPGEARAIEAEAMAALGLRALAARRVDTLSGGERHRAHMARALAQLWAGRTLGGGRWLLLDELTASLDLAHQAAVLAAAHRAAADGAGVLAVLHDLTLAAAASDRVVLLQAGAVVAEGPPRRVLTPERLSHVYGMHVAVTETAEGALAIAPAYDPRATPVPLHRTA